MLYNIRISNLSFNRNERIYYRGFLAINNVISWNGTFSGTTFLRESDMCNMRQGEACFSDYSIYYSMVRLCCLELPLVLEQVSKHGEYQHYHKSWRRWEKGERERKNTQLSIVHSATFSVEQTDPLTWKFSKYVVK